MADEACQVEVVVGRMHLVLMVPCFWLALPLCAFMDPGKSEILTTLEQSFLTSKSFLSRRFDVYYIFFKTRSMLRLLKSYLIKYL